MKAAIILLIASALALGLRSYVILSEISARTTQYVEEKEETNSETGCISHDIKQLTEAENIEITGIFTSNEGMEPIIHIKYLGTPKEAKAVFNELEPKKTSRQ
jgi:hypothetical protein